MKLAVFDHHLNPGGGTRFLLNLLINIKKVDQDVDIYLFCDEDKAKEIGLWESLKVEKICIQPLKALKREAHPKNIFQRIYRFAIRKLMPNFLRMPLSTSDSLNKEIVDISKDFDLAYFPWPYFLYPPNTICPKVATFHDFNFKYFFGVEIFNLHQTEILNKSINEWMKDTTPVVSTHFMEKELLSFYPETQKVNVVHLASLNVYDKKEKKSLDDFPFKWLLDLPYIVCPVHLTVHKNIGNLIAATSLVNHHNIKFRLIFTGKHTEIIKGSSSYYGLKTSKLGDIDVFGLGYISDLEMDSLLRNSFAVINASLYEAGNGIGLDAWSVGIPVIQSNIPAFEEHINLQKFKAFSFDPRDAKSIANAVELCLNNDVIRQANVKDSLVAALQLNWETVALKYLKIFHEAQKNQTNAD